MTPALIRKLAAIFLAGLLALRAVSAAEFKLNGHTFTLPAGFTIELAVPTNLVARPISADFDEQGRLYVTDSSGSNDKPEKQLIDKPHRIVRLEDADGDGVFDKAVVFADKMMFPEGALWHDGSLYVAAPPSIWKLTDTNHDGVADTRVEWFQGKTLTGCANDLHGPYLGPDGWIYWCKGAFAEQEIPQHGRLPTRDQAAHIFRARPDGSLRESFLAGGMDNPVEIAWNSTGELFFTATFIQNPGGGKRDALVHGLYGGLYGKVHGVINPLPHTGELLEPMTHLGPAAPSGLCSYKSVVFGEDFQENLFVTQFNLRKVSRHILEPRGATYRTQDSDFLVSDNHDFHPTDVLEDADGSLLVLDTGGWYKLCCPTSQLAKPDVAGAIYRIRKTGVGPVRDPRGLKLAWATMTPETLVRWLTDQRPAVQQRAIARLAELGTNALPALEHALAMSASAKLQLHAVWALCRNPAATARAVNRAAVRHDNTNIAQVAVHAAGIWRDKAAWPAVHARLDQGRPQLQRAAAEAMGRMEVSIGTYPLLKLAARNSDRALEHSLIHALIELAQSDMVVTPLLQGPEARSIAPDHPLAQRAALLALEQMPGGKLKSGQVLPALMSTNELLRATAVWLLGRHPEWGVEVAQMVEDTFAIISFDGEQTVFTELLSRVAGQPEVQPRIAALAGHPASQATAMSVIARSRINPMPASWAEAVRGGLQADRGEDNLRLAIAAAAAFARSKNNQDDFSEPLLAIARDPKRTKDLRLTSLGALPGNSRALDAGLVDFLFDQLNPTNSVVGRSTAAGVLAKTRFDDLQLLRLVELVPVAGPLELPKLLGAFDRAESEKVGLGLVVALEKSKARAALRAETVKPHLANFPARVQQQADTFLASLNTDAPKQKARLDELSANLKGGDVRRGQAVFNGAKAACTTCHAIGYVGGQFGPDLTKIGTVRTERDLLEAIVFPSASFVRSYEPMIAVTKGGEEFSGILRGDSAEGVTLLTGPNAEQRIARANLAELRPGAVSVMPAGLDEQLSRQELADLVAFLKARR